MKRVCSSLVFILFTIVSFAQETGSPGWLWEVSGNGLEQKSYLFGTCHGDGHTFTKEEVLGIGGMENALKEVKTVLFEGGMDTERAKADSAEIVKEIEKGHTDNKNEWGNNNV